MKHFPIVVVIVCLLLFAAVLVEGQSGGYVSPAAGGVGGLPTGLTYASPNFTVATPGGGSNGCLLLAGSTSGSNGPCANSTAGAWIFPNTMSINWNGGGAFLGTDGSITLGGGNPKIGTQIVGMVSILVSALPAASGTTGQIRAVSDSTTVATEGQTCAGSSTNTALAFSNGTVWKCF